MRVLQDNEKEFYNRYGISLQEKWEELTDELRNYGLSYIDTFINGSSNADSCFESKDILRIVIGYRGKRSLKSMISNALPTARVVVWEPEVAVFLAGCVRENISDFIKDNRLLFVFGRDEKSGLENALRISVQDYNIRNRSIVGYDRFLERNNEDVEYFNKLFEGIVHEVNLHGYARKKYHQLPTENLLYAFHILNNNSTVEQFLEQVPTRDIPVIIVAAGPSLGRNKKELSKAKGKAIIVAVTRAMKTLISSDLVPDLVAATDAGTSEDMDFGRKQEYTLLSSVFAAKDCQKAFNGHIIYHGFNIYDDLFVTQRTENMLNVQLDTGSVATDVFSLFLSAGFKTFILVGQDLAYDNDGYSHAGEKSEEDLTDTRNDYHVVEGIFGADVRTRGDWIRFRDFYENKIKQHKEISVIDATEGGALIRGSLVMPLKEAITTYCKNEYPVCDWISTVAKGDKQEEDRIKAWFEEAEINCEDSGRWLDEAVGINRSIREKWNDNSSWDDEFRASCKRYDVLYNVIINGARCALLRHYCSATIQQYVEEALVLEGDENIEQRMKMESELMTTMKSKDIELLEYIRSLRAEQEGIDINVGK